MKEKLNEERAVDTVGRPNSATKSFGKHGGTVGGSSKMGMNKPGSTEGVGGGFVSDAAKDEPIVHESSFRTSGKDKNFKNEVESGTPRQDSSYQNRDRQGAGLNNEPVYQNRVKSYPTKGPQTKVSNDEDV